MQTSSLDSDHRSVPISKMQSKALFCVILGVAQVAFALPVGKIKSQAIFILSCWNTKTWTCSLDFSDGNLQPREGWILIGGGTCAPKCIEVEEPAPKA